MDRSNVAGDKLYARHSFAPDEAWRQKVSLVPFALFYHSSLGWSWRKGKQILLKLCAQYLYPQFPSWSTDDKKALKK